MSNTIKRKNKSNKPRILGKKELAQGGFTPYLEKEITALNGEQVLILHLPISNRTVKKLMNLDTSSESSLYDAMIEVVADHLVDEKGSKLYENVEEAGDIPVELISEIVQAMVGSMVNIPGTTQSREKIAEKIADAVDAANNTKDAIDPLATTESESVEVPVTQ